MVIIVVMLVMRSSLCFFVSLFCSSRLFPTSTTKNALSLLVSAASRLPCNSAGIPGHKQLLVVVHVKLRTFRTHFYRHDINDSKIRAASKINDRL